MGKIDQNIIELKNLLIQELDIELKEDIRWFQKVARQSPNLREYCRGRVEAARNMRARIKDL